MHWSRVPSLLLSTLLLPLALAANAQSSNPPRIPATTPSGAYVPSTSNPRIPPTATTLSPLQTELIAPLDISRLHPGTPILVKLSTPWSGRGCKLALGSTVSGHVAEVNLRTKQNHVSRVTVLFDTADCNGQRSSAFPTTLVAVLAGNVGGDPNLGEGQPLADAVGLSSGGGIRGAESASAITDFSGLPTRKLPAQVLPGQVVGLSRIKLAVSSGLDGGSVLSSPNHDVRLEATTHLILMPRETAVAAAAPAPVPGTPSASTSATQPQNTPPEPIDQTTICASACNFVDASSSIGAHVASATFVTGPLGYRPKENREVTSLGYDSTLTYLDAQNLLFTFDPHKLRERGGGIHHESARTVRAVLIDPSTHSVRRVADWRVYGEGQYLWRAGSGQILAHVGHQLRLFSSDLNPIRSTDLRGAVAWVSASPSGNRFAVGVYNERHSDEIHEQIFQATGEEPQEDVDVRLYDANLNLLLNVTRSSDSHRPVLSDNGEIRISSDTHRRWHISEYTWTRTTRSIATIKSACRPDASTSLSGLLFVVGCEASGARWYRMLREDGHPVLKAISPSQEIQQTANSSDPSEFAIRVIKAVRTMAPGQPFRRKDLQQEEISIYRSSDGHRLFATSAVQIPLADQSFAVSPSGHQLALLGDSDIAFFPIEDGAQ